MPKKVSISLQKMSVIHLFETVLLQHMVSKPQRHQKSSSKKRMVKVIGGSFMDEIKNRPRKMNISNTSNCISI